MRCSCNNTLICERVGSSVVNRASGHGVFKQLTTEPTPPPENSSTARDRRLDGFSLTSCRNPTTPKS